MNRSSGYGNAMSDNLKNLIKLLAILAGMVFLFWLWLHRLETHKELEAPEGETISIEDVHILLQALNLEIDLEVATQDDETGVTDNGQTQPGLKDLSRIHI